MPKLINKIALSEKRRELKNAFTDIINGYTMSNHPTFGHVFVKHFTQIDNSNIDHTYRMFYDDAIKSGVPKLEERMQDCINSGAWDEDKEKRIKDLYFYIDNSQKTKTKITIKRDRDALQAKIESYTKELEELEFEKSLTAGVTAETYANKKINEYYIYRYFFSDMEMMKKKFTLEEFDDLSDSEMVKLIQFYNKVISSFQPKVLKQISLIGAFTNFFYICNDNPYIFYGKPVVELTFYQVELFSNGLYFKNLLSNTKAKPPEDVYEDPEQLIDWVEQANNMEKTLEKGKAFDEQAVGGVSVPGATVEEIQRADPNAEVINLSSEAKKMGKSRLNMTDIMKMQGIKIK